MRPATDAAAVLAGFVAAEGSFIHSPPRRFKFAVSLGATDTAMCTAIRGLLGVGRVTGSPRRQQHHDDEVTYQVQSLHDLVEVVVPFMDEHLPPCHKRDQYFAWRAELLAYWTGPARSRPARGERRSATPPATAPGQDQSTTGTSRQRRSSS